MRGFLNASPPLTVPPPAPQVRAGSLQELVYKQGQAGVTKASVSIVFNNNDPERSPVGYEHCEQITVTRQASRCNCAARAVARHFLSAAPRRL